MSVATGIVQSDMIEEHSNMGSDTGPRIAPAPFDKTTADVILRTSDKVDFYVYKAVLFLASTFFESMFSLEQAGAAVNDEKPILDVPEDSSTLDDLLRFCYPVYDPSIKDLAQLSSVLQAAADYEIPVAIKTLRDQLRTFVQAKPREVFAISCHHNLNKEARHAASMWRRNNKQTLEDYAGWDFMMTIPGGVFVEEMKNMSAGSYFRLLRYLRTGNKETNYCSPSKQDAPPPTTVIDWTTQSPFNREDADITICSCDGVDFRVHKLVLVIAGAEALLRQRPGSNIPTNGDGLVTLDIDSRVLGPLLQLCYPPSAIRTDGPEGTTSPDTRTYGDILDTAVRYEMTSLVHAIRLTLAKETSHDALSLYLIAARLGWISEAQAAAERLIQGPLDGLYSPELERTTANHYQSLLEYHHNCQSAIQDVYRERHYVRPVSRYAAPTTEKPKMRWNEEWFKPTQETPTYVRAFPSVLLDAEVGRAQSNHAHVVDFQKLVVESQKMDTDIRDALQKVSAQCTAQHMFRCSLLADNAGYALTSCANAYGMWYTKCQRSRSY